MRVVVLCSGGVDSSVMLQLLKKETHQLFPLFINYGQLAAKMEWKACSKICRYLELTPKTLNIPGFGELVPSGLTNRKLDVQKEAFLPTRNLLFLTLAAAYGYVKSAYVVAIGLLSNPIFPDQTREFIALAQKSISESLGIEISILSPLLGLKKSDTLRLAHKHKLPLTETYSCHTGGEEPCGLCISCKERMAAERVEL